MHPFAHLRDATLFLEADLAFLMCRLRLRGRREEQQVDETYLERVAHLLDREAQSRPTKLIHLQTMFW